MSLFGVSWQAVDVEVQGLMIETKTINHNMH